MMKLNIVLYEPEIPQNTGNIARLCACTGASLYLVGKLGFSLSSKYTKRAGLDYWDSVDLHKIDTMDELLEAHKDANFYYLTTKTKRLYTDIKFQDGDFIVFGPETRGLPAVKSFCCTAVFICTRRICLRSLLRCRICIFCLFTAARN